MTYFNTYIFLNGLFLLLLLVVVVVVVVDELSMKADRTSHACVVPRNLSHI